jgi:hypothetical protein
MVSMASELRLNFYVYAKIAYKPRTLQDVESIQMMNRGQDIIMKIAPGFLVPDARLLCQIDDQCDIAQGDRIGRIWLTGRFS